MSYDKEPPWTRRFFPDGLVIPAEPTPLVWPSIAWLVFPPIGQGRGPVASIDVHTETADDMTGDGRGGLFALSLRDAAILEDVLRAFTVWDEDPEQNDLLDRLIAWRARHTSEATP